MMNQAWDSYTSVLQGLICELKQSISTAISNSVTETNTNESIGGETTSRTMSITETERHARLAITKQTSRLQNGDFVVFIKQVIPDKIGDHLLGKSIEWKLPIRNCITKEHTLAVFLNRKAAFQHGIRDVLQAGEKYSMSAQGKAGVALVNAHAADGSANLTQLREMLLCLHVQRLLHANGYDVHMCGDTVIPQLHSMFGSSPQGSDNSAVEVKQDNREKLLNVAVEASPFKLKNEPQHSTESTDTLQPLALSAQEFIKQEGLLTGGQHYSKNLDILTVKQGQTWTPAFHEVIRLDSQQNLLNNKDVAVVVHVASAEKQYYQQQVDILWRMLCEISVPQVHLTHASVTCQKGRGLAKSTTASDLIKLRTEQMKEAYVVKYGDVVKGAEWDDTIQVAASAIVKFEMLSTSSNTSVKLDLLQTGGLIGSKGGAFVLYNYARLSTLFQHHEEDVEAGYYPALPDFEDVDTSLLVEEEEWSLLFNYILPFPTLVKDCVGEFHANSPHANIYTHKICAFLASLSRTLSVYYSRVHVLVEPREHLMPTMAARLYLLRALKQVMSNALALLDIVAPSQM